ncbi:hypothetical protein SynPROSU1_02694 [Synechococcus sp. PROS-U-1]|nr:hypothetical protein SynPROSU1_02694 [Synechococcus sp. PROS-U-1]
MFNGSIAFSPSGRMMVHNFDDHRDSAKSGNIATALLVSAIDSSERQWTHRRSDSGLRNSLIRLSSNG